MMRKELHMEKKKVIKTISVAALVLLVGAFALNGWALNSKDDKDGVLATVDKVNITQNEVDERIAAMLGPQAEAIPPEKLGSIRDQLNQRALDSLIVEALLKKAIEKENVMVGDEKVDAIVTQFKASLPADMTYEEYLKQIGFTEKELKQTVSKNLRIQKLLEQQFSAIAAPEDQEIEAYYTAHAAEFETPESVDVRHILIAVNSEDSQEKKAEKMKKAQEIREQVIAGKDFETAAGEVSDCPSKAKGGHLGFIARGQTVKPFEDAAFGGKAGELGPVVETRFGYHVIEVLGHKDAGKPPLSEVKEQIAKDLSKQKKDQAVRAYIDSLKAKATIVFHKQPTDHSDPA